MTSNKEYSTHVIGVLERAAEIAEQLGHPSVDENVLFFALSCNFGMVAANILTKSSINPESLWQAAGDILKPKKSNFLGGYNKKAKSVLQTAEFLSEDFEVGYVSPEILLLAFFSPENCPKVLRNELDIKGKEQAEFFDNLVVQSILANGTLAIKDLDSPFQEEPKNKEHIEDDFEILDMFEKNEVLSRFAENLNISAAEEKFDKIIDYDNKIDELATILCRKKKPNAIIVGKAGCGKTSLVQGLATRIVKGDAPDLLANKVIYSVNLSSMVAGTQYRGQFEQRLEEFVNEAKKYSNLILFIDEIHTLVGAGGGTTSSLEASNILKPELASGSISCIGATTINEYTNTIKRDSALDRRFERVVVQEPSKFKMQEILPEILEYYENFHVVKYAPSFVSNVIDFCERFIPNRAYPDKAVDVIDHCGAQAKVKFWEVDKEIKDKQKLLISKIENEEHVEDSEIEQLHKDFSSWEEKVTNITPEVTLEHLQEFFATKGNKLSNLGVISELEKEIKSCFYGDRKPITNLFKQVKNAALGLATKHKHSTPDVFLVCGEASTGKSLLSSLLADNLEKLGSPVLFYNGTQFSDYYAQYKIISHNNNNTSIAEKVIINPNASIIIDDFDKINHECSGLISQILKEGYLQMSNGDIADFSNCKIFVFTGVRKGGGSLGFNSGEKQESSKSNLDASILDLIKNESCLSPLNKRALRRIVYDRLKTIEKVSSIQKIDFSFDFKFIKDFVEKHYNEANPIKSLNDAIEKEVISKITS